MALTPKENALATSIGCFLGLLFVAGISALFGWITQTVLAAFGVRQPLWICILLWFLVSSLFNAARAGRKDS